jgi:hypothetical protein
MFNNSFVFVMSPDPDPDEILVVFDGQRSIIYSRSYGPEVACFLEVQRWMIRIGFQ